MEEYSFNTTFEPPKQLTKHNVIYWSEDYQELEGVTEANAIKTKAKKWLEHDCIVFSQKDNCYICKNISGYNSTIHKMRQEGDRWSCSCQFHNKVVKDKLTHLTCSHVLALKLYKKMLEYNGEEEKYG